MAVESEKIAAIMRLARRLVIVPFLGIAVLWPSAHARAQTAPDLAALRGLVAFGALLGTAPGRAALASNYTVTGAIQNGTSSQPALQPFADQQQQALKDAFITGGNAFELADGLGTALGDAYRSLTAYASDDDGATSTFESVSPSVAAMIDYTAKLTEADAASAKYFFANESASKSNVPPLSKDAQDVFTSAHAAADVYGKAYRRVGGSAGADAYGDSRPFQTEPNVLPFSGTDFFGVATRNTAYLTGPTQNLTDSPSFPSGHTTYGYTESLVLALMVPQRFSQMIARAAEYGNGRIVIGAHYAMDVIAGRTLALYDVAHLLAEDPAYVDGIDGNLPASTYQGALEAATTDLRKTLEAACLGALATCAGVDSSRFAHPEANAAFYESTQTYGLPVVYASTAQAIEDVSISAPEAGYILTTAFPNLTLDQADRILTDTEGPGGGFLDDGSGFGIYSRLDLYKAGEAAASFTGS